LAQAMLAQATFQPWRLLGAAVAHSAALVLVTSPSMACLVTSQRQRHIIKLYVRSVFFMDVCDELMHGLRTLVKSVVDSEHFPLSILSETLQVNEILRVIEKSSVQQCLEMFAETAEKKGAILHSSPLCWQLLYFLRRCCGDVERTWTTHCSSFISWQRFAVVRALSGLLHKHRELSCQGRCRKMEGVERAVDDHLSNGGGSASSPKARSTRSLTRIFLSGCSQVALDTLLMLTDTIRAMKQDIDDLIADVKPQESMWWQQLKAK